MDLLKIRTGRCYHAQVNAKSNAKVPELVRNITHSFSLPRMLVIFQKPDS